MGLQASQSSPPAVMQLLQLGEETPQAPGAAEAVAISAAIAKMTKSLFICLLRSVVFDCFIVYFYY